MEGWRLRHFRASQRIVSLASGATVSYVFVRMLPEMDEAAAAFVSATAQWPLPLPTMRVYVAALLGFILFYGLQHLVVWAREQASTVAAEQAWSDPIFLLHVGGFAFYVWLVSYLMDRRPPYVCGIGSSYSCR